MGAPYMTMVYMCHIYGMWYGTRDFVHFKVLFLPHTLSSSSVHTENFSGKTPLPRRAGSSIRDRTESSALEHGRELIPNADFDRIGSELDYQ
jgi:hypothetical protein